MESFPCDINNMIPIGYVDADYARDTVTRRSCTGLFSYSSLVMLVANLHLPKVLLT